MKRDLLSKFENLNRKSVLSIFLGFLFVSFVAKAQPNFPFVSRNIWDGPYDIKMVAAPNLEPVYANPTEAASNRLKKDSLIRYATMMISGGRMNINNDYKEGAPFNTVTIPLPALVCPDPNAACYNGLATNTTNGTCPVERYQSSPTTVSRMIAMNYADYDTDNSTFASSMAQLDIPACAEIEAAYLYWTGNFRGSADNITLSTPVVPPYGSYTGTGNVFDVANDATIRSVLFKRPGGAYQTITANAVVPTAGANNTGTRTHSRGYLCVANVTAQLQGTGGGQFWVGNIRSYPHEDDGGSTSGWVLVVVSRSPLSPPRRIQLWDGFIAVNESDGDSPLVMNLTGLQAPSTVSGFQSYIGFAALDGENLADELVTRDAPDNIPEGLGFQTNGGPLVSINPLCTEQPKYRLWVDQGSPANAAGTRILDACNKPVFDATWALVCDGVSSSHITSYDPISNTNGNEIVRLPAIKNTLGIDAHHIKLQSGNIAANATSATLTVRSGPQGGTSPFLAYIAIERLQPKLEMTKSSNVNTTGTSTQITYRLRIKNNGNTTSLGNDIIRDTLDEATTFVAGSLIPVPAGSASLTSTTTLGDGRQALVMNVSRQIPVGDSVVITFRVQVKDFASNIALWDVQCKRTITNIAWIEYNTATSGILIAKSNGDDCGIGSETRVLIQDALFGSSTTRTIINASPCPASTDLVLNRLQSILLANGVTAADLDNYDIRTTTFVRVQPEDIFLNATTNFLAIKDNNGTVPGSCQTIYEIRFACTFAADYLYFNANEVDGMVRLDWATSSSVGIDHFVLEKSSNGLDFSPIGIIKTSKSKDYSYVDMEKSSGIVHYRLVQYNSKAEKAYSKVVSVFKEEDLQMNIYPNPFLETSSLLVKSDGEESFSFKILDLSGKLVYFEDEQPTNKPITIGGGLLPGIYVVEVVLDDAKLASRLVKID